MLEWRSLMLGDRVVMHVDEFDTVTPQDFEAEVVQIECDHAIARGDGMSLWIDDDTQYMFRRDRDE